MLPNPTKGDTMLPNKNPAAPSKAEAVPACSRAFSMASVVAEVKVSPNVKSRNNSSPSNTHTELFATSAAHTNPLNTSMPAQLVKMQVSRRLNLTQSPAPATMAAELSAKNKLKAKAEKP